MLPPTDLVIVVKNAEVADGEDDLVKEFLIDMVGAVPQQVAGDVTELKGHRLLSQGALSEHTQATVRQCPPK